MTTVEPLASVQDTLFGPVLACVHCNRPIDTSGNYSPDPPAHVYCAFRAQQRREAAAGRVDDDPDLRNWLHQIRQLGYCLVGDVREVSASFAEGWPRMTFVWDDPDRLQWLAWPSRDCPGPPYLEQIDRYNGCWQCNSKHWHATADRPQQQYGPTPRVVTAELADGGAWL